MCSLRPLSFLCAILLGFGTARAQAPSGRGGQDMQVELTTAVKARKAKAGDTVTAVTVASLTLSSGLQVPARTKVIGHVRSAEADSANAHTSSIALVFEEIQIKKGETVPLRCFIRAALLPKLRGVMAQGDQGGQSLPPVTGPAAVRDGESGDLYRDLSRGEVAAGTGSQDGSKPVAVHTGQVIGMPGVELQIVDPGHVSVFRSSHKNLELDEGLELMLVVLPQ